MMRNEQIATRLAEMGEASSAGPARIPTTGIREADALVGDLANHPHAFVLACIMDRQVKAARAWAIPYLMSRRLGGFDFVLLASLSSSDIHRAMAEPRPLHRYVEMMSRNFYDGIHLIATDYAGDASRIWSHRPSSAELIYRFHQFRGVGHKIASMAANILARDFKIPLSDYSSIDVSADLNVRRVFQRLGLAHGDDSTDEVIYRARSLHPKFPGLLDGPTWEIGRGWCHAADPDCGACYMNDLCPTAATKELGSLEPGADGRTHRGTG